MKKFTIIIVILILALLTGCSSNYKSDSKDNIIEENIQENIIEENIIEENIIEETITVSNEYIEELEYNSKTNNW